MANYQVMYTNIYWPIGVQAMTILMVLAYVLYKRYGEGNLRYDWRFFFPGAEIASAAGAVPIYQLGLFSVFDQINASLTSLPSPFIDITQQSIMTNLGLVWTVLISIVWLGTRY